MKKWLALLTILFILTPATAFASTICEGVTKNAAGIPICIDQEVGPFMQGITVVCGNEGNCSLTDIQQVFANIGNWVVGIVGVIVFLMYVYGGFMYLSGGVNPDGIKKGKQALKISTIGLLIVFGAYAGIKTLESVILDGKIAEESGEYVTCGPGNINEGAVCGYNRVCSASGLCVTKCEAAHGNAEEMGSQINNNGEYTYYDCKNINDPGLQSFETLGGCQQNLCPGTDEIQCCQVTGKLW